MNVPMQPKKRTIRMTDLPFAALQSRPATTTTDLVYRKLHDAIVALELPPGTKMSEADVARQLDVSRQPVRDAFFRLSDRGFLLIRPQRATLVSKISEVAVRQATFVRTALEVACLREAIALAKDQDLTVLNALLDGQKEAIKRDDSAEFHKLDDAFHRTICEIANQGATWDLIAEQKAHMDRVRHLSLPANAPRAYNEHLLILQAVHDRDPRAAEACMTQHLNHVFKVIGEIRAANPDFFISEDE